MDNVVRLRVPRIELPRALPPGSDVAEIEAVVSRIERLQAAGELEPSSHDRLQRFLNSVRYQAYGRRGWSDVVARLEAATERAACVHSLLLKARSSSDASK